MLALGPHAFVRVALARDVQSVTLPANHPERVVLNDEVHARPPEAVTAPARISYLALFCDAAAREASFRSICSLAETCGVTPPEAGENHFSADLFAFRVG